MADIIGISQLYDLVEHGYLLRIRYLLNLLSEKDRQALVNAKINGKSLLLCAVANGQRKLVKYLLTDCGAKMVYNFDKPWLSPMIVAINRFDIRMILLLTTYSDYFPFEEVFKRGYYFLASIFILRNNQFNAPGIYITKTTNLHIVIPFYDFEKYTKRSVEFIYAADKENFILMKLLLSMGVNLNLRYSTGEDALCWTILNNRLNSKKFLIDRKLYSQYTVAIDHELCGAKLIIFEQNKERALECWMYATKLREDYMISHYSHLATLLSGRIDSLTELLHYVRSDEANYYLLALHIFRIFFSSSHNIVRDSHILVCHMKIVNRNPYNSIMVLSEIFELSYGDIEDDLNRMEVQSLVQNLLNVFVSYHTGENRFMIIFDQLVQIMSMNIWQVNLRRRNDFFRVSYYELVAFLNRFLADSLNQSLDEVIQPYVKENIAQLHTFISNAFSMTLIHSAILEKQPVSLVEFLLCCTGDPDCFDSLRRTPLHLAALTCMTLHHKIELIRCLNSFGAHMDSMDSYGERPLDVLRQQGLIANPLNYLSLKCLAAQAIQRYPSSNIRYSIPNFLLDFIKIHSNRIH